MPETAQHAAPTTTKKPSVNDVCSNCNAVRGAAPEGLYDVHSAFGVENVESGDPKWQEVYCWQCGAKY